MWLMGIRIWTPVQKYSYSHLFEGKGPKYQQKERHPPEEQRKTEIKLGDGMESLFCF